MIPKNPEATHKKVPKRMAHPCVMTYASYPPPPPPDTPAHTLPLVSQFYTFSVAVLHIFRKSAKRYRE